MKLFNLKQFPSINNMEYQRLIRDLFDPNLREEVNKKVHPRGLRYQRKLNQLPNQNELLSQLKSLSGIKGILYDIKDSRKVMTYIFKKKKKEIQAIINGCEKELYKLGVTIKNKQPIELPLETLRKYIGFYRLESGGEISIDLQNEKLIVKNAGIGVNEIFPESEFLFFEKKSTRQFEFHQKNAAISGISLHKVDGQTLNGQKVK